MTVALETARELLDLGARLRKPSQPNFEPPQAVEQLQGAVAIHNILEREGVAYLADEVGMGKTYVALGAIALFRHYQPSFRVAVVAPRENIQLKWMKEWTNFATHIVQVADLRMKALHGGPARPLVTCDSLRHFVRETTLDPERDFFLRLSSFSLATGDEEGKLQEARQKFRNELPWLDDDVLSLRSKQEFKDNLAKAICCAIPTFDLLVIDEAHNLKHGFSDRIAARNRVMAFVFGRESDEVDRRRFPFYGSRAKRVLFLSATPIEDDYRQLWNQLDVVGRGSPYHELTEPSVSEGVKKKVARRFLIRRVTTLRSGGERLTKNMYRREWRHGGLVRHDDPIRVDDPQQRLVVALVQKKVAELLNSSTFNATFQMGMLASFESFLETATKLKPSNDEDSNFDNVEQTQDELERKGIDVHAINGLARDFRRKFGRELPHPKMDALVVRLSQSWTTGRKSLVFLRRVASVWELKERLDLEYNRWLAARLRKAFAVIPQMNAELEVLLAEYERARGDRRALLADRAGSVTGGRDEEQDRGGLDTLFAWFFRGEGPPGDWLSGAKFSQRFGQPRYALSTFFEDNYAATLLKCPPEQVRDTLALALGWSASHAEEVVSETAGRYMTKAKRPGRGDMFEAVQAAAVEVLRERAVDPDLRHRADVIWHRRFEFRRHTEVNNPAPTVLRYLESPTFFAVLQQARWVELKSCLWPSPSSPVFSEAFVEQELRRHLLATAARLGHAVIDLYTVALAMRGSMRTGGEGDDSADIDDMKLAEKYLGLLEQQRTTALLSREWGAFDELAELGAHFDLIMDVNEPLARSSALAEVGRLFGALLRQQQPVGGMTGQVNKTLVRQFRMPGYPLALLSTDLLQEGEDLHTFCADIYHYGLAWTPSAVEQRIGRIDRVRSKTERTAVESNEGLTQENKLQVYFPHLEDTIERLQVRRVLKRMQEFARLMHEGLGTGKEENSRLNVAAELLDSMELPPPISTPLETAFRVLPEHLRSQKRPLAVTAAQSRELARRLSRLREGPLAELHVSWETQIDDHAIYGTVVLTGGRLQPFALHLKSFDDHLLVRCVSPVGRLDDDAARERVVELSRQMPAQLGVIEGTDEKGADLTVEEEVLLGEAQHDQGRVAWLVRRVALNADQLEHQLWSGHDVSFEEVSNALRTEGRILGHDA